MITLSDCNLGPTSDPVLRGVSLEIHAGEFWGIIGPNGSGKTTLVRTLLGLRRPLSGRILGPQDPDFGKRVAYVPQHAELAATLPTTPREWVRLGLTGLALSRTQRRDRVQDALGLMKLEDIALRDLSRLSAGQRQRTIVARALARKALLLVLDEPTEGLDAESREILLEALDTHHASGGVVILVTHRLEELGDRAQHIAVVDENTVRIRGHSND